MSVPTTRALGSTFIVKWGAEKLIATVSRVNQQNERTTCYVKFETFNENYHPHLFATGFNLTSSKQTKDKTGKALSVEYPEINEDQGKVIIEQMCVIVLDLYMTGENPSELLSFGEIEATKYKIDPIIAKNKLNILFGDGMSMKSTLATLLAVMIQLPWHDNPMGWTAEHGRMLILDWESDKSEAIRVLRGVVQGAELPEMSLLYRRCYQPLVMDIEAIQKIVMEGNIDTIIIDSLGVACGGDLNAAQPALAFISALRSLNVTSIVVHHGTKESLKSKKGVPTPFGSIYFYNEARIIWEIRKYQEEGSSIADIAMLHRKINVGKLLKPIGLRCTFFDNHKISIVPHDTRRMPIRAELSGNSLVMDALRENHSPEGISIADIAQAIQKPDNYVRSILSRLHREYPPRVVKLSRSNWGLASTSDMV